MEDRTEIGRFEADFMSYIHMIQNTPHYAVVVMYPVTMNYWTMPGNNSNLLEYCDSLTSIAPEHHMRPLETIEQVDLADSSVLDGFVTRGRGRGTLVTWAMEHMEQILIPRCENKTKM